MKDNYIFWSRKKLKNKIKLLELVKDKLVENYHTVQKDCFKLKVKIKLLNKENEKLKKILRDIIVCKNDFDDVKSLIDEAEFLLKK